MKVKEALIALLGSRILAAALVVLALAQFPALWFWYLAHPRAPADAGPQVLFPILAAALVSAQCFKGRPLVAACLAAAVTFVMVVIGSHVDTALDVYFGGPMPWSGEKVAVGYVLAMVASAPAAILALLGSALLRRNSVS